MELIYSCTQLFLMCSLFCLKDLKVLVIMGENAKAKTQIILFILLMSPDLDSSVEQLFCSYTAVYISVTLFPAYNWAFLLLFTISVFSHGDSRSYVLFERAAVDTFLPFSLQTVSTQLICN